MPTLTVKDAFAANIVVNTLNSNGQAVMASSAPVTIASNQTKFPVTLQSAAGAAIDVLSTGSGLVGLLSATGATDFFFSTVNSTVAQLAAAATFTGTVETIINAQAFSILATSDQNGTLTVKQYIDAGGTRISSSVVYLIVANVPFSRCITANGNYLNLTFQNTGGSTTTTLNINTAFGTLPAVTAMGNGPIAIAEIDGAAIASGNGVTGPGSLRVTLASDTTANTNPFLMTQVASAAQGAGSTHHLISAASTNATSVKASAGTIGTLQVSNLNVVTRYLKLYNKASAPTVGTDTPVMTILIPPSANLFLDCGATGIRFTTGIAYALTTGITVADATAVNASEHSLGIFYT